MIQIPFEFINEATKNFFADTKKSACLCGGFGSGKTYIACFKILFLSTSFKNYRSVIARQEYKVLKLTTLKTFLKICPERLIARWNEQEGTMKLLNGSEIIWMHLDAVDEQTLRGLEINSVYIDQTEEVNEAIFNTLEARVARWEKATPETHLIKQGMKFEVDAFSNYIIPSYMMITPNPDVETHWIYRRFHPESPEYLRWKDDHSYFEVASTDNPRLNPGTLKTMLSRDPSWVKRFVYGKWGISEASIHVIYPDSVIDVSKQFIENLIQKGNCYRVLDHGDSSPTCCLWFVSYKGMHFCYREYYQAATTISTHRKNIHELSGDENYLCNLADPQIFKTTSQKLGGFWSVAQEYTDPTLSAPPLPWQPADNNELSTRNRINELLALDDSAHHPLTNLSPAPRLYFIKKSTDHSYGCEQAIVQLRSQRRVKLGELNGKPIFSDERDQAITDHAYDPIRYYIAGHAQMPTEPKKRPSETSFLAARQRAKMLRVASYYD